MDRLSHAFEIQGCGLNGVFTVRRFGVPMSPISIVMMVLICGFVWGGFSLLLARAMRSEGSKKTSK